MNRGRDNRASEDKTAGTGGLVDGMRSWLGRTLSGRARTERQMELLEVLSLGGKRQLMLVRCEDKRYLVGLGGDSVQSIVNVGKADEAMAAGPIAVVRAPREIAEWMPERTAVRSVDLSIDRNMDQSRHESRDNAVERIGFRDSFQAAMRADLPPRAAAGAECQP